MREVTKEWSACRVSVVEGLLWVGSYVVSSTFLIGEVVSICRCQLFEFDSGTETLTVCGKNNVIRGIFKSLLL